MPGPNVMTSRTAGLFACPMQAKLCIGPRCAAWWWLDELRVRTRVCDDPQAEAEPAEPADIPVDVDPTWHWQPHDPDNGEPAHWYEPADTASARRPGRCGMVVHVEPDPELPF